MSKKILVIDDDKHVRYSFVLTLGGNGFIVNAVESGEKGINELTKNNEYDLIFLDLKMLGMDGVETLRHIRSINSEIPVYVVTAFQDEYYSKLKDIEDEELNFELLTKPLDRNQLLYITQAAFDNP